MDIKKFNLIIKGHSRGAEKTGFYIPQLKLFLDAGLQSYFEPNNILITHCHTDHTFALPMLLTGIKSTPSIYVPLKHKELFENYVNATYQLSQGDSKIKSEYPILGIKENDVIKLNNDTRAIVYNMDHSVECCGYGLVRTKQKLKTEYATIGKEEIIKLKKNKVIVTENVSEPMVAYLTDTTTSIFDKYKELLKYPYIIIECTFFREDEYKLAHQAKHTHWNDLKPIIEKNQQITFLLIHFSMRYENNEIKDFFNKQNIENILLALE